MICILTSSEFKKPLKCRIVKKSCFIALVATCNAEKFHLSFISLEIG